MLPIEVGTFAHLETRILASQLPKYITCWRYIIDSMEMSRGHHIISLRILLDRVKVLVCQR